MSWVLHDKTLQETIAYPDKRKSLLVIQIQETLWRKLNNLFTKPQGRSLLCKRGQRKWVVTKTPHEYIRVTYEYIRVHTDDIRIHTSTYG